jgi:uncharacterized protein YjbI with pentapeptide repeats
MSSQAQIDTRLKCRRRATTWHRWEFSRAFAATGTAPSSISPLVNAIAADNRLMTETKLRHPADPLYQLMRQGNTAEFNRLRQSQASGDFHSCDLRGLDLTRFDVENLDFSDAYFRQADLRGLDLRTCRLAGASLHAAHVSGVYFPAELAPEEIEMSVRLGTRLRYR